MILWISYDNKYRINQFFFCSRKHKQITIRYWTIVKFIPLSHLVFGVYTNWTTCMEWLCKSQKSKTHFHSKTWVIIISGVYFLFLKIKSQPQKLHLIFTPPGCYNCQWGLFLIKSEKIAASKKCTSFSSKRSENKVTCLKLYILHFKMGVYEEHN